MTSCMHTRSADSTTRSPTWRAERAPCRRRGVHRRRLGVCYCSRPEPAECRRSETLQPFPRSQPATRFPLFVSLVATSCLPRIAGCETPKTAKPPNIVILMSDNHSWNHIGSCGDPVVRTPTIDRVAGEGIRFTNAFCSAPSCTLARASMLTGQGMWRLEEGANLWGALFPPSSRCIRTYSRTPVTWSLCGQGMGAGQLRGRQAGSQPGWQSLRHLRGVLQRAQRRPALLLLVQLTVPSPPLSPRRRQEGRHRSLEDRRAAVSPRRARGMPSCAPTGWVIPGVPFGPASSCISATTSRTAGRPVTRRCSAMSMPTCCNTRPQPRWNC